MLLDSLKTTFQPLPKTSSLKTVGEGADTRGKFFGRPRSNLHFLLEKRFGWMRPYLADAERIVEVGSGSGLLPAIIGNDRIVCTDVVKEEWIDEILDANLLDLPAGSVDVLICSQMIHHLAYPVEFLRRAEKALKPGGRILIVETTTSWVHRVLMALFDYEGWSFDVDLFNEKKPAKAHDHPLAGNNAIPGLLFEDPRFASTFPNLEIEYQRHCEFLIFGLSGGVTSSTPTVQLPYFVLNGLQALDSLLTFIAPGVFALSRKLVLRKRT